MKTLLPPLRTSLLALGLAASAAVATFGADDSKKTAPASPEADKSLTKIQPSHLTLDFPGGSVAQLIATINKPGGPGLNLLGEKDDLAIQLPAFAVRNVHPSAFAQALRQLLEPRGLTVIQEGPDMFVLRKLSTMRGVEPTSFESFQLGSYLEKQSIDDVVGAIRIAWELNPANKPDALQLKFHPPTKLLLVSGTRDAINVASKVISTLAGAPEKVHYAPAAPAAKR